MWIQNLHNIITVDSKLHILIFSRKLLNALTVNK